MPIRGPIVRTGSRSSRSRRAATSSTTASTPRERSAPGSQSVVTISYPRSSSAGSERRSSRQDSRRSTSSGVENSRGWWAQNRNLSSFLPRTSKERNFPSAFFSLIAVGLISAALADDEWFHQEGGGCDYHYLGVTWFYGLGRFSTRNNGARQGWTYIYHYHGKSYTNCVTPHIAGLFHAIMGVSFVALVTALASFILELAGPKRGFPKWLRRNAVFSTFSVILCVLIVGLSYWVSLSIDYFQRSTAAEESEVYVRYSDGFYLIVAAGGNAIIAVAITLYKSSRQMKEEDDRLSLLENLREGTADDDVAAEFLRRVDLPPGSTGPPPPLGMIMNIPPPPPYAP